MSRRGAFEVVALDDLLAGLIQRVVDFLEVDVGGDVERHSVGHVRILRPAARSAAVADAYRQVSVTEALRYATRCAARWTADVDRAATEEPLEIRLHDRPFAVIMRTPGADRELAAGFLLSEGVLVSPNDIGTIAHCTDPRRTTPRTSST